MFKRLTLLFTLVMVIFALSGCSTNKQQLEATEDGVRVTEDPIFSSKVVKMLAKGEKADYISSKRAPEKGFYLTNDYVVVDASNRQNVVLKQFTVFSIIGTRYYRGVRGALINVSQDGFNHSYFAPNIELATDAKSKYFTRIDDNRWYKVKAGDKEGWVYGDKVKASISSVNSDGVRSDGLPSAKDIAGTKGTIMGISLNANIEENKKKLINTGYQERKRGALSMGFIKNAVSDNTVYSVINPYNGLTFIGISRDIVVDEMYRQAICSYAERFYGKPKIEPEDNVDYYVYDAGKGSKLVVAGKGIKCGLFTDQKLAEHKGYGSGYWNLFCNTFEDF